jgi:hypothetical protein
VGQHRIPLDEQEPEGGGVSRSPSSEEVLKRLEILRRKLEDEGLYVRANTVFHAIEEIKRLRKDEE